jgi:hypothetical protein
MEYITIADMSNPTSSMFGNMMLRSLAAVAQQLITKNANSRDFKTNPGGVINS